MSIDLTKYELKKVGETREVIMLSGDGNDGFERS